MPAKTKYRTGFSLMEIIISIGVIGILVGSAAPLVVKFNESMEIRSTREEMENIRKALYNYYTDVGGFPLMSGDDSEKTIFKQGLDALFHEPTEAPVPYPGTWNGPYISGSANEFQTDSWGNKYIYELKINGVEAISSNFKQATAYNSANIEHGKITTQGPGKNEPFSVEFVSGSINLRENRKKTSDHLKVLMDAFIKTLELSNVKLGLRTHCMLTLEDDDTKPNEDIQLLIDNGLISEYHAKDQWGHYFVWMGGSVNQFYSAGPDGIDNSCGADSINPKDVAD